MGEPSWWRTIDHLGGYAHDEIAGDAFADAASDALFAGRKPERDERQTFGNGDDA